MQNIFLRVFNRQLYDVLNVNYIVLQLQDVLRVWRRVRERMSRYIRTLDFRICNKILMRARELDAPLRVYN